MAVRVWSRLNLMGKKLVLTLNLFYNLFFIFSMI